MRSALCVLGVPLFWLLSSPVCLRRPLDSFALLVTTLSPLASTRFPINVFRLSALLVLLSIVADRLRLFTSPRSRAEPCSVYMGCWLMEQPGYYQDRRRCTAIFSGAVICCCASATVLSWVRGVRFPRRGAVAKPDRSERPVLFARPL